MKSLHEYVKDLESEGYTVEFGADVAGVSGVSHHVDILAKPTSGDKSRKPILGLKEAGRNPIEELIRVYVIALDTRGQPCYITGRKSDHALVKEYGIVLVKPD